ncbi:MAG: hypothetical protein MK102_02970 [Fuerstiella sp.]|nr:hypothetical protein [Fuerstiella sp.]
MTDSNASPPESTDNPPSPPPDDDSERGIGSAWTASGDDLPELEELTPELVEEEAIRGDFMLRGAVILLAVLFGCGQIADSTGLVHIRSGTFMQSNGFLPPRTDVFSIANEDQPTANVSWLFDHLISVIWSLGGAQGLTIFKACIGGLIAWLLTRISLAGLPTWWNSICGVIAIAACASDLMPITDLVTLSGLMVILWLLHGAFEDNVDGLIWKAPLTIAIWANMDPRAWIGVIALLLFSAGRSFATVASDARSTAAPALMWKISGISVAALLINPFPVASLLSVIQTYQIEYPALRALYPLNADTVTLLDGRTEYYSLFNYNGWGGFEFGYVAAILVILFAVVALVLSRDRRDAPWTFLLTGFIVLAALTIHELAVAALVAAAIGGTVGQRWYQKTFPQEYTVNPSEVLFSRAGRALTVFSFAALGFLVVTDRLPTRTPVGSGFTKDLQTTLLTLQKQLQLLPEESRVLHSRVDLGNFLIWANRKSYIDTRVSLFGSPDAPDSATRRYLDLRRETFEAGRALANKDLDSNSEDSDSQNAADDQPQATVDTDSEIHQQLQTEGITHFIAGLYPPEEPHLNTIMALSADSASWRLTSLESSSAVFDYLPTGDTADDAKPFDLTTSTFRDVEPTTEFRFEFAREKGFYDRYLYRTRTTYPEELRVARLHLAMADSPSTLMTAIRAANRLVTQDDQNANGFYFLAYAYARLADLESRYVQQTNGRYAEDMRYMQIVMAGRQAVTIDPEHVSAWNLLYSVYVQRGKLDQALECLNNALPLLERGVADGAAGDQQRQNITQLQETQERLRDAVTRMEVQVAEELQQVLSQNPAEVAAQKYAIAARAASQSQAHLGEALRQLQQNRSTLEQAPQIFGTAETLRGRLLLETGALQSAYELYMQLDAMANNESQSESQTYPWTTMSIFAQIGLGSYANAADRMATYANQQKMTINNPGVHARSMATLPLVASIETTLRSSAVTQWPLSQLIQCRVPMSSAPITHVVPRFLQAMIEIEGGSVDAARINLQSVLTEYGVTPYRAIARLYLTLLQEDLDDFAVQNSMNAWEDWPDPEFVTVTTDDQATEDQATEEQATEDQATEDQATEEQATEEQATPSE